MTVAPTLGVVTGVDEEGLLERTREILLNPIDALVVTTGIGFRSWLDAVMAAGLDDEFLSALDKVRLIARGPKARGALQAAGLTADWVAESETSQEILDFLLAEGVSGDRIAVQHHGAGDAAFDERLRLAGATVISLEVYRWGPAPDPKAVKDACLSVAAGEYDAVLFTSAPAASAFLAELDSEGITEIVRELSIGGRLLLAGVGPITADPLASAGMMPVYPERSRMGALVRQVIITLGERPPGIATPEGILRFRASSATLDHEPLPLSPTSLAVLRRLAREPGEVVSRERLLHALPGDSADPHSVEVAVARLRDAIAPKQLVRTIIKRGYVLQVH